MDTLLTLTNANKLYEDTINSGNLRWVHGEDNSLTQYDYDSFISTRCNSTTETIRFLISDSPDWISVESPSKDIYQISFKHEMDDDEDDPLHSMIVHGNDVYQSYFGLYPIRKTTIPNLEELLMNPHEHWLELTGDPVAPEYPVRVQYLQPVNIDLAQIEFKYKSLCI